MTDSTDKPVIDYGPLKQLIGLWKGDKGIDIAPEDDGEERNIYHEVIKFEPVRDVSNAEEQELVAIRYEQVVTRHSDQKMIHNECGYLSWEQETNLLMKSFSIPRGVALVAGGSVSEVDGSLTYQVEAAQNNPDWGIVQSPFMQQKALTKSYQFSMQVSANQMKYSQSMMLDIFGKSFEHTDENQLTRVE